MDIILDTDSCHYRTTWEMFLKNDDWVEECLPTNLVLVDCAGLSSCAVNKKIKFYKGKTIFLVNASPEQAAHAAAIFYDYMPVSTVADVIKNFFKPKVTAVKDNPFSLSCKEFSILKMLSNGFSNKEISKHMNMPLSTTKYYLQKIYKKMNVANRTEAALACVKINL